MCSDLVLRVREGLAELVRRVNSGGVSTAEAREILAESRAFEAQVAVLQADAAALVAAGERNGDDAAGVLAKAAGLSKRDAAGQVKTVENLHAMPEVRGAVADGQIPLANARVLARACEQTTAADVAQDAGLLEKAASLPVEQFARETSRWVAQRGDDGGEAAYRRQRARRRLSIFDGDGGMVCVRGELDPVVGARMHKRLLKEAERLRRCDLNNPGALKRSLSQRLADALDTLTAQSNPTAGSAGAASAEIAIVQHLSPDGDKAFAEIAGGGIIPQSVLEEHFCSADIVGVVYTSKGVPLWRGTKISRPTKAQMDALVARYGNCGGCGEHHAVCQGHHIWPRSQGGPNNIDNLMLLCWTCHQKVHHHRWRVVPNGKLHTIAPPERIRHGPAHAPETRDPPHIPPHMGDPLSRRRRTATRRDRAPDMDRPTSPTQLVLG